MQLFNMYVSHIVNI